MVVQHATWQAVLKYGGAVGQWELHMNAGAVSAEEAGRCGRRGLDKIVSLVGHMLQKACRKKRWTLTGIRFESEVKCYARIVRGVGDGRQVGL